MSTLGRHAAATVIARACRVPAVMRMTCRMTVGEARTRRQPAVAIAATAATGRCRPRLGPMMGTAAAAAAAGGTAAGTNTAGTTADVCCRLRRSQVMRADAAAAAAVCVAALVGVASCPTSRGTTTIVTAMIGRMAAVAAATAGGVTAPCGVSCRPAHHGTTATRLVVRSGGGTVGAANTAAASAGRGLPTRHLVPLGSPATRVGGTGRAPVAAVAAAATGHQRRRGGGGHRATAVARATRTRRGGRPVRVRARPAKICRRAARWPPATTGSTRSPAAAGTTGTKGDWRR